MPERIWEVTIDNENHVVKLDHSYWTDRQKVWLDGVPVQTSWKMSDRHQGKQTFFLIGKHLCVIEASSHKKKALPKYSTR